jgi:hypothetical protein
MRTQLVSEYNSLEARLAVLEVRQPLWFNAGAIVPPMSPNNAHSQEGADSGIADIRVERAVRRVSAH